MTPEEFYAEEKDILEGIPEEFKKVISYIAWQQGHSAGYHEVIIYLNNMAYEFRPAIKAYNTRIFNEVKNIT